MYLVFCIHWHYHVTNVLKLEFKHYVSAIREDRTRGGRSSYGGASPQVRTKPPPKTRTPSSKQGQTRRLNYDSPVTPSKNQQTEVESPSENKEPDMTSVVTMTVEEDTRQQKVLEDLLAVEVLMADDEEEQSCCNGKLTADDADIFTSLLHFADHSLYKIVRWARNLPDFAKISVSVTVVGKVIVTSLCNSQYIWLILHASIWHYIMSYFPIKSTYKGNWKLHNMIM